ncbi:MAG TPA: GlsB/YeaQ/YmgE family stress response membrane protein [Devosia sp.]|nr:GlsB/YeaQ/YmgE family stress response membrane protein [Devosia sp.]
MGFILAIIIGGIAGYIADRLMSANNVWWLNIALGVGGAALANFVLGIVFGLWGGNLLWQLLTGIAGASALIWGYRQYQRR